MTRPLNDQGVSVIIGTLLLILITVTAAAALALMISQMQKTAMTQQEHIAEVKAENVQFSTVNFQNDPNAWNQTLYPSYIVNSENWSSVTLHLVNLNTEGVGIVAIAISSSGSNAQYASNITLFNGTLNGQPQQQNINQSTIGSFNLGIPGGQSREIQVNFTDPTFINSNTFIPTNAQVKIIVMTSLNNFFQQTYKPPNPIVQSSIASENLGVLSRDVLVLDGSQSTSDNTIDTWNWSIVDASNTGGNCGGTLTNPVNYTTGKVTRFNPPTVGPFCVNLTITDDTGMMATSNYINIPADPQFSPPANLYAAFGTVVPDWVNVTVKDIHGIGLSNLPVNYIVEYNQFGDLTLSKYEGTTDLNGNDSVEVMNGNGTIKIVTGQLSPIELAVNTTF
jgi:flagellin-like protein